MNYFWDKRRTKNCDESKGKNTKDMEHGIGINSMIIRCGYFVFVTLVQLERT